MKKLLAFLMVTIMMVAFVSCKEKVIETEPEFAETVLIEDYNFENDSLNTMYIIERTDPQETVTDTVNLE